jgi:hypothetical protein
LQLVQLLPFDQYLLALLTLERQVIEWQGDVLTRPTARPLARQIFDGLLADRAGTWRKGMQDAFTTSGSGQYANVVPPGRPEVLDWAELADEVVWAEVGYADGSPAGGIQRVEFFRNVDGAWRHTRPDPRFLGEEVTLDAEHFRLVCHEREAMWLADGLADLESLYRQMADAIGTELPPGERLTIRITSDFSSPSFSLSPGEFEARLPSPYLSGWSAEGGGDYLASLVTHWLLARLAFRAAGVEDRLAVDGRQAIWWHVIVSVWQWQILGYDMGRVVPGYGRQPEPLTSALQADKLLSISELGRMTFGPEPFVDGWASDDWELLLQEMAALVHYAGKTHGQKEGGICSLAPLAAGGHVVGGLAAAGA